ncbi:hypothetical protein AAGT95_10340 [Salinicola lusitanus]|uniref:Uncharacterized protein n=1 Tax=Salinicola lusitanus TaxID=1949085 RepID=A0ABZ3CZ53_9GAMM
MNLADARFVRFPSHLIRKNLNLNTFFRKKTYRKSVGTKKLPAAESIPWSHSQDRQTVLPTADTLQEATS